MRSGRRSYMWVGVTAAAVLSFVVLASFCRAEKNSDKKTPKSNDKCYVCHLDLKNEKITTTHLKQEITCHKCHGPSDRHLDDEMLMTPPDRLFGRAEVKKMCLMCHDYDGDHDPDKMKAYFEKWLGRRRPNGRAILLDAVCTDCHGTHNIVKDMGGKAEDEKAASWVAAFNGRDLGGWQDSGDGRWQVKRGRLTAQAGPGGAVSAIWTEKTYQDCLLAVTFQASWPIHAGVWLRGANGIKGPRVEIFENDHPKAYTGSVVLPGKGLALLNLDPELVDREGWNTLSIEARGDRFGVWLNGKEIGAVRAGAPAKGRIGLYLGKGAAGQNGQVSIREVMIQELPPAKKR